MEDETEFGYCSDTCRDEYTAIVADLVKHGISPEGLICGARGMYRLNLCARCGEPICLPQRGRNRERVADSPTATLTSTNRPD